MGDLYPDTVSSDDGIIETSTVGPSEFRQLVGSDPGRGLGVPYLRVPSLASGPANRYLFLLAYVGVPENERIVITDLRQRLDIGCNVGNNNMDGAVTFYPFPFPVTTDDWSFSDGNVSWHLTRVNPGTLGPYVNGATDAQAFNFRVATSPSLLYGTATLANPLWYTTATAYTPPNGGQPYGQPLTTDLATWYDLRFPRNSQQASGNFKNRDIVVDGNCGVALWASVKQTGSDRTKPKAGAIPNPLNSQLGITPEEGYILNYNGAQIGQTVSYWGVGGSILWRHAGPSRGRIYSSGGI